MKSTPKPKTSVVKAKAKVEASAPTPNVHVVEITPEIAEALLKENTNNRPLNRARVRLYVDAMKRGQWKLSGDSIKRATDKTTGKKRLIDGQHRLQACIESGITFTTVVVDDLEEDVFSVIDRGKNRSVSDVMHIAGVGSFKHVAPAVRIMLTLDANNNVLNSELLQCVTPDDVLKYIDENSDSVAWALSTGRTVDSAIGGIRSSWIIFCLMADKAGQREAAEEFLDSLRNGAGLVEGNVCLALRNWLVRANNIKRTATIENAATYAKAFNAYLEGRQVQIIRPWSRKAEWPVIHPAGSTPSNNFEFEL